MSYPALLRYKDSIKGITLDSSIDPDQAPCPGCEAGKQTRLPFPTSRKCRDSLLYKGSEDDDGLGVEVTG